MPNDLKKIIQISDVHLLSNPDGELLKVPTQASFNAIVNLIKEHEKHVDGIILTGDLSQDGSDIAYQRIADCLEQFNVPIYWIPGNHDNLAVMERVYPRGNVSNQRQIIMPHWQLILLDSHIHGAVPGHLDQAQLQFMQQCLQDQPTLNAMILFHHPPFLVDSAWLDNILLNNAEEFWQAVSPYQRQIKAVVCGHVHQELMKEIHGMPCYSVPSTCIQFKPQHNEFALDPIPPGYRWIELNNDGSFKTGVRRLTDYIGEFDTETKGY